MLSALCPMLYALRSPLLAPIHYSRFDTRAPGTATLLSPSKNIKDKTPTYTWNTVEGATMYLLYVEGRSGKVIKQWYDADTITSGDTCSVTPDVTLARGKYRWKIRAWNDNGYGDWSNKLRFKVTR